MQRLSIFLIAACLLALAAPAALAQEDCGPLPTRLEGVRHAVVSAPDGVFSSSEPGGAPGTLLPAGTLIYLSGSYTCRDGVRWWMANSDLAYGVYAPETVDGVYVLEPFAFTPAPPVPFDVPLTPPLVSQRSTPLPLAQPSRTTDYSGAGFGLGVWDLENDVWKLNTPDPRTLELPAAYAGNMPELPVNLSEVHFVVDADLNAEQLALLAQNGFVVVPGGFMQFEDVYRRGGWSHTEGKGDFITTDAMLHLLYFSYENALKFLEMEIFYGSVTRVAAQGFLAAQEQWRTLGDDASRRAAVYYLVPLLLLADGEWDYVLPFDGRSRFNETDTWPSEVARQADAVLLAEAQPIVDLIRAAEGREAVPILENYVEDFSQYIVRGYYNGSPLLQAYFRAMMWMGRITFTVRSPQDTMTGLMVLRALRSGPHYDEWRSVAETLDFLVGPEDDYGPEEYDAPVNRVFGANMPLDYITNEGRISAFIDQVKLLPGPRINSIVLPLGTTAEEVDPLTRGFRLFGQRFTFDGYIMQELIYPKVGTASMSRALPLGLDVAAALGSDLAFTLADAEGATDYANYTEQLSKLRTETNGITPDGWMENLYGGWLWALQPLLARDAVVFPPYMRTDAWLRKDIHTTLASWTQLKHATVLYAEQPYGGLGGGGMEPPVTSYTVIEHNPEVFARIALVANTLRQGLRARMPDDGRYGAIHAVLGSLSTVASMSAQFADMARRQLLGESLAYEDYYYLQEHFANRYWYARYNIETWTPDPPERLAIVTDVATNADAGTVLQVGVGDVDLIYVVTDSPFGLQVTRGGVFSYYEFVGPIDERMTDETWRELVAEGNVPPRPTWIDLYFAD